jgi:hypothetical protein
MARAGDRYGFTSSIGRPVVVVLGEAVHVRNQAGQMASAIPVESGSSAEGPSRVLFLEQASGRVVSAFLGCTLMETGGEIGCMDRWTFDFARSGGLPPLWIAAPTFAELEAVERVERMGAEGGRTWMHAFDVDPAQDSPEWGPCRVVRSIEAPALQGLGEAFWSTDANFTVCRDAPVAVRAEFPSETIELVDYLPGNGTPYAFAAKDQPPPTVGDQLFGPSGQLPPRGPRGSLEPFDAQEAFESAKSLDPSFALFLDQTPDAILHSSLMDAWGSYHDSPVGDVYHYWTRHIVAAPPGKFAGHEVALEKRLFLDRSNITRVLTTGPFTGALPAPARLAEASLTLDAAEQAAARVASNMRFLSIEIRPAPLACLDCSDAYGYHVLYESLGVSGATAGVHVDSATGRIGMAYMPRAAAEHLVPSHYFERGARAATSVTG